MRANPNAVHREPSSREPLSRDGEGVVIAPERSAAPGPTVVTERAVKPRSGTGMCYPGHSEQFIPATW